MSASRLHDAADLIERLPDTVTGLEAGRFSVWHALTLVDATRSLDAAQAAKVEKRVLARAGEQSVANLRRSVLRAVQQVDTRRVEEKHRAATADRRVVMCPERDAMTGLYAYLPAPDAARIMNRLNHAADAAKGMDDRTTDQHRADALVELITGTRLGAATGSSGKGGRAEVQITLSLDTLRGRSDQPGELAGYGPLPAAIAAELARTYAAEPAARVRTVPLDQHRQAVAPAGVDDAPPPTAPACGCTNTSSPAIAAAASPAATAKHTAAKSTTSPPSTAPTPCTPTCTASAPATTTSKKKPVGTSAADRTESPAGPRPPAANTRNDPTRSSGTVTTRRLNSLVSVIKSMRS